MPKTEVPYSYLSIEGNIGAGKTTLTKMLAKDTDAQLVLEQFSENPFLKFFYEDPERYAFPVELFFMTERQKQLQKHILNRDLFSQTIIADYIFIKTALFARKNLGEDEYRLFMRIFRIINTSFPKPDILVYLHRSVDSLLEYIRVRGRDFEYSITGDYLLSIQNSYFDYFRSETSFPILVIDCEEIDFANNHSHYEDIRNLLTESYQPGMHHVSLIS